MILLSVRNSATLAWDVVMFLRPFILSLLALYCRSGTVLCGMAGHFFWEFFSEIGSVTGLLEAANFRKSPVCCLTLEDV
ncbi:unnamed protein product [Protopolystoma xenopodis]|uniref:Uncharacterized protein n=1 Tax=Protopolystoma xenopodis TaxID=117903 RepID=A0A448X0G9_9PLAT|nr:unnamed protein product [Protopolystoma xenopodis]